MGKQRRRGKIRPSNDRASSKILKRDPEIPGPNEGQLREAAHNLRTRRAPLYSEVKGFDEYLEWFSASSDPFIVAYLAAYHRMRDTLVKGDGKEELLPVSQEMAENLRSVAAHSIARLTAKQETALGALKIVVEGLDPLPVLCGMIVATRVKRWGTYFEPDAMPKDLDLELVTSIIAASRPPSVWQPCGVEDWFNVARAAKEVRLWAYTLNLAYGFANEISADSTVRKEMLERWLAYRGEAYEPHATALARSLVEGRERSLLQKAGYTIEDVIKFGADFRLRWESGLTPAFNAAWDVAAEITGECPPNLGSSSRRFKQLWFEDLLSTLPFVFGIPVDGADAGPNLDRIRAMIEDIGLRPGDGIDFKSVFVDPPQRTKPFMILPGPAELKDTEFVVLAHPAALTTDLHLTVESILSHKVNRWDRARADAVDRHVLDMLRKALPGSVGYSQIFIDVPEGRAEVDGVLIYEDVVILIEGKGPPLKTSARRGGVGQYVTQLKLLIGDGNKQLDRDHSYVTNGRPAKFYRLANGPCLFEIDGESVRRCYRILPTLDGLAGIGTRLGRLVELGVLESDARPFIVSVTALNVVIDTLKRPADLIGYLEFREHWIGESRLLVVDELEMLALYLYQVDVRQRLDHEAPPGSTIMHALHQYEFDAQYNYLQGQGVHVDPLKIQTTARVRRFVDELQRMKPPDWLATATAARQIPITVATALDDLQGELAHEARLDGVSIRSDGTHAYVALAHDFVDLQAWSAQIEEVVKSHYLTILLRQNGRRLSLEDVICTRATR